MRFLRQSPVTDRVSSTSSPADPHDNKKDAFEPGSVHQEHLSRTTYGPSGIEGRDVATQLFTDPEGIHEPFDDAEEKRLVRKIDWMILPYLAVCYAFFVRPCLELLSKGRFC